jgi:hypothetical protein
MAMVSTTKPFGKAEHANRAIASAARGICSATRQHLPLSANTAADTYGPPIKSAISIFRVEV